MKKNQLTDRGAALAHLALRLSAAARRQGVPAAQRPGRTPPKPALRLPRH